MAGTVHQVFSASAARFPARPFLHVPASSCLGYHSGPIEISYADMAARVAALAAIYAAAGNGHGSAIVGLAPEGTGTRLTLVHEGFDLDSPMSRRAYEGMKPGWPGILERIASAID